MPLPFTTKKQQLQFINTVIGVHDIACDCLNPAYHSLKILTQQIGPELQKQEKEQLQKCLGTPDTTEDKDQDGFDVGDLEALFTADTEPEDADTG